MELRECILGRRSIRRFQDRPIGEDILRELLEAVRWSPSWANTQCWEVILVREEARKKAIAGTYNESNPATQGTIEAPVVAVFCARKGRSGYKKGTMASNKGDWFMFDLGIACQNFCLAAYDLGLGTVFVGSLDHQKLDQVLELPDGVEAVAVIPLGYPAQEGKAPPRKPLADFVFIEKYGQPAGL